MKSKGKKDRKRNSHKVKKSRGKLQPWHPDKQICGVGSSLVTPHWKKLNLPPILKDLHSFIVNQKSPEETEKYHKQHNITVNGTNVPKAVTDFTDITLPESCIEVIKNEGFTSLMPIQAVSWPIILHGKDMVGIAATGSGKTLAYVLPGLLQIRRHHKLYGDGVYMLVLAPTRELALQIQQVCRMFGKVLNIKNVCIYGGANVQSQIKCLKDTPEIIIATPGRLLQFVEEKHININSCSYLVLDEADRMLDMGFSPQIQKVVNQIRPDRQIVMYSATWPDSVRKMARQYMKNMIHVTVGSLNLTANRNITQNVIVCKYDEKNEILFDLLKKLLGQKSKILIFCRTRSNVQKLESTLEDVDSSVFTIHGSKKQSARETALNGFRNEGESILIATDVAGRGLDIDGVDVVINYDFPYVMEDYVHRIGRCGRVNNTGTAYTLFTPGDSSFALQLIAILKAAKQPVSEQLEKMVMYANNSSCEYNDFFIESYHTTLQDPFHLFQLFLVIIKFLLSLVLKLWEYKGDL